MSYMPSAAALKYLAHATTALTAISVEDALRPIQYPDFYVGADWTAKFQACIDAFGPEGGILKGIPGTTYTFTTVTQINLASNIIIDMEGCFIQDSYVSNGATRPLFAGAGVQNVTFRHGDYQGAGWQYPYSHSLSGAKTVQGITNAAEGVFQCTAHGLDPTGSPGQVIIITGGAGMSGINGTWTIYEIPDVDHFKVQPLNNGAYERAPVLNTTALGTYTANSASMYKVGNTADAFIFLQSSGGGTRCDNIHFSDVTVHDTFVGISVDAALRVRVDNDCRIYDYTLYGVITPNAKEYTVMNNRWEKCRGICRGTFYAFMATADENGGFPGEFGIFAFNSIDGNKGWDVMMSHDYKRILCAFNRGTDCRTGFDLGNNGATTYVRGGWIIGNEIKCHTGDDPWYGYAATGGGILLTQSDPANASDFWVIDQNIVENACKATGGVYNGVSGAYVIANAENVSWGANQALSNGSTPALFIGSNSVTNKITRMTMDSFIVTGDCSGSSAIRISYLTTNTYFKIDSLQITLDNAATQAILFNNSTVGDFELQTLQTNSNDPFAYSTTTFTRLKRPGPVRRTATDGATSVSLFDVDIMTFTNTGATNVATWTNIDHDKEYTFVFSNANTTITAANTYNRGGGTLNPAANTAYKFRWYTGSALIQVGG